jgi:hypothetical protein
VLREEELKLVMIKLQRNKTLSDTGLEPCASVINKISKTLLKGGALKNSKSSNRETQGWSPAPG